MMKRKTLLLQLVTTLLMSTQAGAQTIAPDLQDEGKWRLMNRTSEQVNEPGKKGIRLSEASGDGAMILKEYSFADGTIEMDVKGENKPQQSFVGLAFHGIDSLTYDAIYFRPFNFINPDTSRRSRAVQYVSMPDFPWEKLRKNFPGKYENKVSPVPGPDGWFHVKITVSGRQIKVFVNHSVTPCLVVEKLSNTKKGGIALWVGNNSGGAFANLNITPSSD